MEATELGLFMISACLFGILLFHPDSPAVLAIPSPLLRRVLMAMAMGGTAIAIIYSPWGKQSGAHFNPAVTFMFWRLGRIAGADAVFYMGAQFIGGAAGVALVSAAANRFLGHPDVSYVTTQPGVFGLAAAFAGELTIAFIQMSMVLRVSNHPNLARYTGAFAGTLVATYIVLEQPFSGMSMNPARTFSSALPAGVWTAIWIYFIAPPAGMLLAAELYVRQRGLHNVFCAKLHHHNDKRCIFRCNWPAMETQHQ